MRTPHDEDLTAQPDGSPRDSELPEREPGPENGAGDPSTPGSRSRLRCSRVNEATDVEAVRRRPVRRRREVFRRAARQRPRAQVDLKELTATEALEALKAHLQNLTSSQAIGLTAAGNGSSKRHHHAGPGSRLGGKGPKQAGSHRPHHRRTSRGRTGPASSSATPTIAATCAEPDRSLAGVRARRHAGPPLRLGRDPAHKLRGDAHRRRACVRRHQRHNALQGGAGRHHAAGVDRRKGSRSRLHQDRPRRQRAGARSGRHVDCIAGAARVRRQSRGRAAHRGDRPANPGGSPAAAFSMWARSWRSSRRSPPFPKSTHASGSHSATWTCATDRKWPTPHGSSAGSPRSSKPTSRPASNRRRRRSSPRPWRNVTAKPSRSACSQTRA